jgi:hypothetical protein
MHGDASLGVVLLVVLDSLVVILVFVDRGGGSVRKNPRRARQQRRHGSDNGMEPDRVGVVSGVAVDGAFIAFPGTVHTEIWCPSTGSINARDATQATGGKLCKGVVAAIARIRLADSRNTTILIEEDFTV